jgi:hypothetical protein
MYNFTKSILPHSSVPSFRSFHSFRSCSVPSYLSSSIAIRIRPYLARILLRSYCSQHFYILTLLLFHYSVHLRYCYPSPYISVIVLWHQYPLGYWYPRPSLLFRPVYKPDKLVVVLQFVINLISLTLSYSKPLFLSKSYSPSSSLLSPSPLRLSGTYPVTP